MHKEKSTTEVKTAVSLNISVLDNVNRVLKIA